MQLLCCCWRSVLPCWPSFTGGTGRCGSSDPQNNSADMSDLRTDEPATIAVASSAPAQNENDDNTPGPPLAAGFRKRFAAPGQEFVLEAEFRAAPGFTILFGPSGAGK